MKKKLEAIEQEIQDLKAFKKQVTGTQTEVYARIVGYYRSVRNWNKGKKEEYGQRLAFNSSSEKNSQTVSDISSYVFFHKNSCPHCPPVKNILENCALKGESIKVDDENGMEKAQEHNVFAAPTVILFNNKGRETGRFHKAEDLNSFLNSVTTEDKAERIRA